MNHSEIAPLSAYTLFRSGRDTFDISQILRISEAEVVKQIDKERAEFKQWKSSFPKAKPKQRRRLLTITDCVSVWE